MAKKQKIFTFDELSNDMNKVNPYGSIITSSPYAKVVDWISLGNYALNAQISGSMFKGIAAGRITMLAGSEGCLHPKQKIKVYISKRPDKKDVKLLE